MKIFGESGGIGKSVAALCLPSAAAIATGVAFLAAGVPRISAAERERVEAATEKAAMDLRDDPSAAEFVWTRSKGIVSGAAPEGMSFPADMTWKEWNPETGTKRKDMWGWRKSAKGRLVWTRGARADDSDSVYGFDTEIEERDWALAFFVFVPLSMAVLAWTTAKAVLFLAGYAKTRDDFLAAAAHDLTTPLAAMRLAIGRDDRMAKRLDERMLRIVSNIKDFLRMGGKRPAPAAERVDLVKAFREAYALFRDEYRDLRGEDVRIAEGSPASLEATGDATMVVQTMWNILGNDLKYAAPYGKVSVSFRREGGMAKAAFIDEGPGMDRREMARAFDRYYRAKTVLRSGKGGFGIGLCTAKESVEAMGGRLEVAANSPRGCVFTLSLPLAPANMVE